ncbi:P-II family nitrogen regulator [Methanoculleus sp. YWC-01]|jgi:nitrogen regulatory protein P-II 1|uniref:P-II family nitrogen regulator n=1 Tax=Methanoculleus nereidis TaxID=2735141 RepID=A0ABU3Z3N0_9EURY|nr:P-II family nitrogen regulator [Methanoculleus sp. YWC-01]MCK9298124.1 P-II family nitrogen regulator [Methanoculleus sp.]MDV4343393.1 P-II family nitrogen regulator [Methanoculleus sp. YWC-01]PKL57069.1 MAG: transcriptional regulator [Methanomicrobiales archaeon HGW-Methanomicrobiales-6]
MSNNCDNELIVTIVKRGWSEPVLAAARGAGAEGGTILLGRGTGIHEVKTLLGIAIEPEKEIILTVVTADRTDAVLEAIVAAAELDQPGMGLAFVLPIRCVTGRVHMFRQDEAEGPGAPRAPM